VTRHLPMLKAIVLAIAMLGHPSIVSAVVIPNGGGHFQILVTAPSLTDAWDTCVTWVAEQGRNSTCRERNSCASWNASWDGVCYEGKTFIFGDSGDFQLTVYIDENKEDEEQMCDGNPIAIPNGDKTQTEVDYTRAGVLPLQIRRQYSSNLLGDGRADGWRFLFGNRHRMDVEAGANRILVRYPNQGYAIFTSLDGIDWITDPDITIQLERELISGAHVGWKVISDNDQVEVFDLAGQLTSVHHRGRSHKYTYNGSITTITDDYGKNLQIDRDSNGYVTSVTDPDNGRYSYTYNADGSLISVSFPDDTPSDLSDNPVRTYHYEDTSAPVSLSKHRLTGITNEKGARFATWAYDPDYLGENPRAILSEHVGGVERVDFSYSDGSVTTTNSLGKDTIYHYQKIHGVDKVTQVEGIASPNCVAANTDYIYDSNGFLSSKTDWNGITTTYIHNSAGLETSRTEAFGTPEARTIITDWPPTLRLPIEITGPGLEATYTYNSYGNRLTATLKDLATTEVRTTAMTYSSTGQVLTIDEPRTDVADVTTFTYFVCSTGFECGQIDTITNSLGHDTVFTEYNAHGQPTQMIDPNGIQTVMTYDVRQRLKSVTVDDLYTTTIEYDDVGQVTRITSPNHSLLDYEYDDAQRLTAIADAIGNRIEFTLDTEGNRIQTDVRDDTSVLRNTQSVIYDELSRMLSALGANSQTVDYQYDPNSNPISVAIGGNPAAINQFDGLNQLIQVTDAESGITQFSYDGQKRLTTVTDPNELTTTYTYNGFGDLLSIDSPDAGLSVYSVDEASNRLTITDARGLTASYDYDALNRRMSAVYTDASLDTLFIYDNTQNGNKGIGRLTGIADGSGSNSYTYDSRGLVTSVATIIDTSNYALSYGYDESGQLTSITYPSGRVVEYVYDSANRVLQVSATKDGITTVLGDGIGYEPFGPLTSLDYGNGLNHAATHDRDYRVTSLVSGSALNRAYDYDTSNNITSIVDNLMAANTQAFTYDYLGRLTDADGGYGAIDFGYDATGNRTSLTLNGTQTDTYSYEADTHHLVSIRGSNPQVFNYDLVGNITTRNAITQSFDDRGRLSQSTLGGVITTYTYNALGQRVAKESTVATTQFLYSQEGLLLVESSGDSSREYAYLNGQTIAAWYSNDSASSSTQLSIRVSAGRDDADEAPTGAIRRGTNNLRLVQRKGNPGTVGIRLRNVTIPQGAQIISAHLQFTARRSNRGDAALTIQAQAIGNAPFIKKTDDFNISTRSRTMVAVNWAPSPWIEGESADAQQTPDISSVLQEVVDRGDWSSGNKMLIIVTGTGIRRAYSYNSDPALAAELVVEYSTGSQQPAEALYYYHNDHLGTPQAMTDENQNIVWQADYRPFGEVTITTASIENNLRFPGQYFDVESGLYYNYFRDYDAQTGRYIQSDPIGLAGGKNTYAYVGSNPTRYTDRHGLNPATAEAGAISGTFICGPVCGAVGGLVGFGLGAWGANEFWNWYNNEGTRECGASDAPLQPTTEDQDGWIYGPKNDPKVNPDGSTQPNTWVTPDDYSSAEEAQDKLDPFKPVTGRSPVSMPAGTDVKQGITPGGQGPYNGSGGANEILVPNGLPPGSVGPWEAL